jgi:hypothetical protein
MKNDDLRLLQEAYDRALHANEEPQNLNWTGGSAGPAGNPWVDVVQELIAAKVSNNFIDTWRKLKQLRARSTNAKYPLHNKDMKSIATELADYLSETNDSEELLNAVSQIRDHDDPRLAK